MRRLGALLVAWGCPRSPAPDPDPAPACDEVGWETLVEPVLTTWCTPCHGSAVVGEDRRGAPVGLDFDGWARASAAAELIAGAAGPDTARMPPGGGMSDDERAGLVAWADCGAPGPETPTPPARCAGRVPFEGDAAGGGEVCAAGANAITGSLTVSASPGAALSCVCEVDGDLVVHGAVGTLELPDLWRIGGALRIEGATLDGLVLPSLIEAGSVSLTDASVASLDLDRLTAVDGALEVLRGTLPEAFAPQRLQELAGPLALREVGGIAALDLPRLERVGGDLVVDGLPALAQVVHTSDLVAVDGSLRLVRNPLLQEVEGFGFVLEVGGDVEVGGGGSLRRVDALFDLERIGGSLIVRDEPLLERLAGLDDLREVEGAIRVLGTGAASIGGLGSLVEVGEIEVADNPALSAWSWKAPATVSGSVRVADAPMLPALPLAGLRSVGGELILAGNASLSDPGAPDLASVGGMTLEGNDGLVSLVGLAGLEAVAGDLVIRDNPALPRAHVEQLLGRITVGGTTTVEGNGP